MGLFARQKKRRSREEKLLDQLVHIQVEEFIRRTLAEPKYADERHLARYEFQAYSQSGEDGIIEEIFNRIGTTNRFFVEIGVGNGLQNNSTYLLMKGWRGAWLEGNPGHLEIINAQFASFIADKRLDPRCAMVTAQTVEALLKDVGAPAELDMLSIDIDGNDYYLWQAITSFRPRCFVVEYNATMRPNLPWVQIHQPTTKWNRTCHFGASLKSFELLSAKKGYKLVGCSLNGANAFFVREDLVGDKFISPFSAEQHYEPPRYFLIHRSGHPAGVGKFVGAETVGQ